MSISENIKNLLKGDDGNSQNNNLPWESPENSNQNAKSQDINTKKIAKIGLILLVVIIGIIAFINYNNNAVKVENSVDTNNNEAHSYKIQIHVAGEVNNPGVYELDSSCRIMDAVNAAGGFTEKADKNSLNLAKTLEDGEQILITAINVQNANSENTNNSNQQQSNNGKININTADISQLQSLSGVGPSTAQKIIDYRNANGKFKSIDDLKKVSGIGEKTFAKFADKICV